jgi:hypothetical protein
MKPIYKLRSKFTEREDIVLLFALDNNLRVFLQQNIDNLTMYSNLPGDNKIFLRTFLQAFRFNN